MLMGMSYEEFWHGNVCKWKYVEEAYQLRRKRENEMLWLQGIYNMDAFGTVLANAFAKKGSRPKKYMEEPIRITPMTEEEKELETRKKLNQFREALKEFDRQMRAKYGLDKTDNSVLGKKAEDKSENKSENKSKDKAGSSEETPK